MMRLIYTDEAGTSAKEPVCVVAAVIVDGDKQWRPLESEMRRIIEERVPEKIRPKFVLHATEIFSGGKQVNRDDWPFEERLDFLKEILCLPIVHDIPIAVGIEFKRDWSELIDFDSIKMLDTKPMNSNKWSHLMAFNTCMEKADLFLRKYLDGTEIGSVIAEDVPEMKRMIGEFGLMHRNPTFHHTLPANLQRLNQAQAQLGRELEDYTYRIDHIVDVPHFVKKGRAPILQLADVCAFAFRRCLSRKNHGNDLVLALLGPEQGGALIRDPVWFSIAGSGLFNTLAYWSEEQKREAIAAKERLSIEAVFGT